MAKIKYNKNNPITDYIVKKFAERFPEGTLHSFAKNIKRNKGMLYNTFNAENAWQQAVLLMEICSYLGIPIEEALMQDKFIYDHKEEIEQWKNMYYECENERNKINKELDLLKKKIDKAKIILT